MSPTARALLAAIGAMAALSFAIRAWRGREAFPGDYGLTWAAAVAVRQRQSVYDRELALQIERDRIGWIDPVAYHPDAFSVYATLPSTALIYLPFTFLPFWESVWAYRAAMLAASVAAAALAAGALPPPARRAGLAWGLLALSTFYSFILSFQSGQFNAWVMLGLGGGLLAARRGRWGWAGFGFGLAAMLKVAPALLVAYCALTRRWRALAGAAAAGALLVGLSLLIGRRPDDWLFFLRSFDHLTTSTLAVFNQSLPAYLARLFTPETDLARRTTPLGAFTLVAYLVAGLGLALVWWPTRRAGPEAAPFALALLVLVAFLAGPYNWEHYGDWIIVALAQFARPDFPARWRLGVFAGALLLALPTVAYSAEAVRATPALRALTGQMTLGALLLLALGLAWLWRGGPAPRSEAAE